MPTDVRRLFEWAAAPDFNYREVNQEERASAAPRQWSALAATNRLLRERLAGANPRASGVPYRTFSIAVVSMSGGVGRTTVVANLASALSQNGRRCVAVDLDPQDTLGLHFGQHLEEAAGMSCEDPAAESQQLLVARARGGPVVVPFGKLDPAKLAMLEWKMTLERDWLRRRLDQAVPRDTDVLLIDTPAGQRPMVEQALSLCEVALVVLAPNVTSYSTLPAIEELLEANVSPSCTVRVLVNGFNATRALDGDVMASLRGVLGQRLFPQPVQEDEAVAEALGRLKPLLHEAADSQAAADLAAIAEWIETYAAARTEPGRFGPRLVARS